MPNVFFSGLVGLPGLPPHSVLQNLTGGSQCSALQSFLHGVIVRIPRRFRITPLEKPEPGDGAFSD